MIVAIVIAAIFVIARSIYRWKKDIPLVTYDPLANDVEIKEITDIPSGEIIVVLGYTESHLPIVQLASDFDIVRGTNARSCILLHAETFSLKKDEVYQVEVIDKGIKVTKMKH